MKNIKILIATHKTHVMPSDAEIYFPIHVGAEGNQDIGKNLENK